MPDPNQFPLVRPVDQGPSFDSLDQAAHEVSKDFGKQPNIEQSAALFRTSDGRYVYSAAVTNSDHDNFGMRVQVPKGTTVAGVVHSHPGNDNIAHYFSPNDIHVANQLNVPSYIRFISDNSIRKFTPGKTSLSYLPNYNMHVSNGDPVVLPTTVADKLALLGAKSQGLPPVPGAEATQPSAEQP